MAGISPCSEYIAPEYLTYESIWARWLQRICNVLDNGGINISCRQYWKIRYFLQKSGIVPTIGTCVIAKSHILGLAVILVRNLSEKPVASYKCCRKTCYCIQVWQLSREIRNMVDYSGIFSMSRFSWSNSASSRRCRNVSIVIVTVVKFSILLVVVVEY